MMRNPFTSLPERGLPDNAYAPKDPGPNWTVKALAGALARHAHESPLHSDHALGAALDAVTQAARAALRDLEKGARE
jgi:hypothetical protein